MTFLSIIYHTLARSQLFCCVFLVNNDMSNVAYIYGIKNCLNNKLYIGSTKRLDKRKYEHFRQLKNGKHKNSHLQRSYNENGKDVFHFYLIEECQDIDRKEKELFYIEKFKTYDKNLGYN